VTESNDLPTDLPDGNKPSTIAYRTIEGREVYEFAKVGGTRLWGFARFNGATVIVDSREGAEIAQASRISTITAFGEMKVADYEPIAAWTFPYNINQFLVTGDVSNGGSVTHSGSFAIVSTGTAANGSSTIRTRKAIRYQPRLSGQIAFTATYTQGLANSLQIVGYGDEVDGFFFGYDGEQFGILRRNNGVDLWTVQQDWSEGVFGDYDPTQLNVYQIQFQWLGAGEIRFYIEDPEVGGFVLVHRIKIANSGSDVSIQNPSLPISVFVENTGNTSDIVVRTPSASGGLEGRAENQSLRIVQGAAGLENIAGTVEPILSVQNPLIYQGIANRLSTRPTLLTIATAGTGNTLVQFFVTLNSTLTGAAFTAIDPNASPVESDTTATAVLGGRFITGTQIPIQDKLVIDLSSIDITIEPGDILTVAALSLGSSVSCGASITLSTEA
jgi:hypothetical protein